VERAKRYFSSISLSAQYTKLLLPLKKDDENIPAGHHIAAKKKRFHLITAEIIGHAPGSGRSMQVSVRCSSGIRLLH